MNPLPELLCPLPGRAAEIKDALMIVHSYFKAYFRMASSAASPAKGFSILFDDDNTITGIDNVTEVGKDSDEAPYYNLNGMRVSKPTKGVYIHNGKKVIIK